MIFKTSKLVSHFFVLFLICLRFLVKSGHLDMYCASQILLIEPEILYWEVFVYLGISCLPDQGLHSFKVPFGIFLNFKKKS